MAEKTATPELNRRHLMTHTLRKDLQEMTSSNRTVSQDPTEPPWFDAQWADLATVPLNVTEDDSPGPGAT